MDEQAESGDVMCVPFPFSFVWFRSRPPCKGAKKKKKKKKESKLKTHNKRSGNVLLGLILSFFAMASRNLPLA